MPLAPTIHLNGTSQQSLLDGYMKAIQALQAAEQALAETAPNGRDYYPQGDGALREAQTEHRARVLALAMVRGELEAIAEAIAS